MIAGLEEITSGQLVIDGQVVNDLEPKKRNIALVFQNYALYPHLTVRQNIGFSLSVEKIPFKQFLNFKYRQNRHNSISDLVEDTAAKIGLTEYLDVYPKNLSGGQRQRVALGRAIVRNPRVFLLDEPLSNLDARMRGQMRSEITKLHKTLKTVFVYVTHDQVEAMTMGTKIVVMKDGVIQQIATPNELFSHPVNKFVAGFIGTPPMNFINAKLNKSKKSSLVFGEFKIELDESLGHRVSSFKDNHNIIIGLRPKAIVLGDNPHYIEQNIRAKVTLIESLGEEKLLYLEMNGVENDLIVVVDSKTKIKEEEIVALCFNLQEVHLFDQETEQSLL